MKDAEVETRCQISRISAKGRTARRRLEQRKEGADGGDVGDGGTLERREQQQ
jgi:hypothetical protein